MHKLIILLSVMTAFSVGAATARAGQAGESGSDRGLAIGLRAGLASPTTTLNDFTGVKANAGAAVGLDLRFQSSKMPEISGVGTAGGRFSGGAIRVVTPMFFARRELGGPRGAVPYALLGLGMNINAMDPDDAGGSYTVDGALAVKVAVGAGARLSPKTAVYLEAAYRWHVLPVLIVLRDYSTGNDFSLSSAGSAAPEGATAKNAVLWARKSQAQTSLAAGVFTLQTPPPPASPSCRPDRTLRTAFPRSSPASSARRPCGPSAASGSSRGSSPTRE